MAPLQRNGSDVLLSGYDYGTAINHDESSVLDNEYDESGDSNDQIIIRSEQQIKTQAPLIMDM